MKERNINQLMLAQYARKLCAVAMQSCTEHKPNIEKIKSEMQTIKALLANIEIEVNNI